MIKRALIGLVLLPAALAAAVIGNTLGQGSRRLQVPSLAKLEVDARGAAEALAEAVRARIVSGLLDPAGTAPAFGTLHARLARRYPRVHATPQREVVGAHSLLYTWRGSDAAAPHGLPVPRPRRGSRRPQRRRPGRGAAAPARRAAGLRVRRAHRRRAAGRHGALLPPPVVAIGVLTPMFRTPA